MKKKGLLGLFFFRFVIFRHVENTSKVFGLTSHATILAFSTYDLTTDMICVRCLFFYIF